MLYIGGVNSSNRMIMDEFRPPLANSRAIFSSIFRYIYIYIYIYILGGWVSPLFRNIEGGYSPHSPPLFRRPCAHHKVDKISPEVTTEVRITQLNTRLFFYRSINRHSKNDGSRTSLGQAALNNSFTISFQAKVENIFQLIN